MAPEVSVSGAQGRWWVVLGGYILLHCNIEWLRCTFGDSAFFARVSIRGFTD